jgi:hypothetical protein
MVQQNDASIIVLDKFIQATRDSGYKGTVSALSELVDNSVQAGAKNVWITIASDGGEQHPITISVLDDGSGMDKRTLRQALRFGGSSRFDDRSGLGRYGMGLPNSSLSQARKVEVFSWCHKPSQAIATYLDVDSIAAGKMTSIPEPGQKQIPDIGADHPPATGTLVLWTRCDRLTHSRPTTIVKKLHRGLGQIFRHVLWSGVKIRINNEEIEPIDPLFLKGANATKGTSIFGEPVQFEVAVNGNGGKTSIVTVTFTELPVHELHGMSNEEKREIGIANGAGVSVVRGNREVDFGWFFMGNKRRENYDDWWRAEVSFDPMLDEAFGITHTKQQIRPQERLTAILAPNIESMAKTLNSRVRQAHLRVKAGEVSKDAEKTAMDRDKLLEPLPHTPIDSENPVVKALHKQYPLLKEPATGGDTLDYRIVEASIKETSFFTFLLTNGRFVLIVNPEHPFYKKVYKPLSELETPEAKQARTHVDLLLLAAARAEASAPKTGDRRVIGENRQRWSDVLATFLNK